MKFDNIYFDIADHYNDPWYGSEDVIDEKDLLFPKMIREENLHDFCVGHAVRHSAPYEQEIPKSNNYYYKHNPQYEDELRHPNLPKKLRAVMDLKEAVKKKLSKMIIESYEEYDVEYWSMIIEAIERDPNRYYRHSLVAAKNSLSIAIHALSVKNEIKEKLMKQDAARAKRHARNQVLKDATISDAAYDAIMELKDHIWFNNDIPETNYQEILSRFPIYANPTFGTLAYDICKESGDTLVTLYQIVREFKITESPDDVINYHGKQAIMYKAMGRVSNHDMHVVMELLKSLVFGSEIALYDPEENVMYPYKDTSIFKAMEFSKNMQAQKTVYIVFLCEHGRNIERDLSEILSYLRRYYIMQSSYNFMKSVKKIAKSFFKDNHNKIADLYLTNEHDIAEKKLRKMIMDNKVLNLKIRESMFLHPNC